VIPPTFIQDLLNRVDIVDVVGNYVQLKKAGANMSGLCPFHSEKSPSFTVSPTKQFYHCFGCGKNGTAISFLMEFSGLGFVEAVKELAQNAGMTVPERDDHLTPLRRAEVQAKSLALSDVMTQSYQFYRDQLRVSSSAIDYLKNRGLTGEIAARFGLGYAPDNRDGLHTIFSNYEADALVEAGMVIDRGQEEGPGRKRYDRFRERIMFPIRNTKGQVIGFGGRILDKGEPKYLNSPETPLFQKGNELYGLFEARQAIRNAGYVLVVEGYMDVVALAQLGFPQAVATLGTACAPVQVQKLLRQTDLVIFSFDGDAAGQKAARRALDASLPHVSDNKAVKFLFLPPEHDPDSYVREFGAEAFDRLVKDAMPLSEFLLQEVAAENDLRTLEGRARTHYVAKPLVQVLQPSALRLQIVRSLAKMTETAPEEIESMFGLAKPVSSSRRPPPRSRRPQLVGIERQVIRLLLTHPVLVSELGGKEMAAFSLYAPDSMEDLEEIMEAVGTMGANASFASLSEQLRAAGTKFDQIIAEIAESDEFNLDQARVELMDAVRKVRKLVVDIELKQLSASGLLTNDDKVRYRELELLKKQLMQQIVAEEKARV
jgi:DNA primase